MTVFRILPNGARRRLPNGSVRALGANGSRYYDISGSTSLGVGIDGRAVPVVPMVGQTWLSFSLSGFLTSAGMSGYAQLSIGIAGALSSTVSIRGTTMLGVNLIGSLTQSQRLIGNTELPFFVTGNLIRSLSMVGSTDLSIDLLGQIAVAARMRGNATLTIGLRGFLSAKAGKKWIETWTNFYTKRQAVLNKIDENNHNLAKNAGDAATAAADAIIVTNTRVDQAENAITAQGERTTLLESKVNDPTTGLNATATALNSLNNKVTLQNNQIVAQAEEITKVRASVDQKYAQITQQLSVEVSDLGPAKAIWGLYLDVNGRIIGMQSINDGVVGQINFMADVFRLISPAGADGMEIQNGYIRVWKGSSQRIIGNGFGANNDLMDYFGPNVGVANARKSNAIMWMDQNGNAYWGGSLSAGVLKNAAQTTVLTANPMITVGPFSTNGKTKVVTVGYTANSPAYTQYYPGRPESAGPPPAPTISQAPKNVTLQRSYAGGASTQVATIPVSHGASVTQALYIPRDAFDPNLPNGGWVQDFNWASYASLTYSDTLVGTGNFTYTAAAGSPTYTMQSQNLSVTSVERP